MLTAEEIRALKRGAARITVARRISKRLNLPLDEALWLCWQELKAES
jgi:hypothetical protein